MIKINTPNIKIKKLKSEQSSQDWNCDYLYIYSCYKLFRFRSSPNKTLHQRWHMMRRSL